MTAVSGPRILFGLDRIPRTLAEDDDRLPSVAAGVGPLRLNTVPLPPEAWGSAEASHVARMAAMEAWLLASCGDYNAGLRRGIGQYLSAITAHVTEHRAELESGLARFEGLYRAEDWCWSAFRPLPRAWWRLDGGWGRAELAFWDGTAVIAMTARDLLAEGLPAAFRYFWRGQVLPVSPFRRGFPPDGDGISLLS